MLEILECLSRGYCLQRWKEPVIFGDMKASIFAVKNSIFNLLWILSGIAFNPSLLSLSISVVAN